ncbi:hypothetical protein [Proteus hauseri]|uniref:phage tail fiber protein n=1 Tax=Proteus hauseri TaxID=183417 RepID=UPI0032DAA1BC
MISLPLIFATRSLIAITCRLRCSANLDSDILVKIYHCTHSSAPSFANNEIDCFKNGDLIDIPAGRFISVRVQMPEQSIYNVRMREMEEERRQKEEKENQDTNKTPEIDK